mgnify:CR=1 FL=1
MTNLEIAQHLSKMYLAKSEDPKELAKVELKPRNEDGYEWYTVGHNSTHQFYLGVDSNGDLFVKSYTSDYRIEGMSVQEYIALMKSDNEEDQNRERGGQTVVSSNATTECNSVNECNKNVSGSSSYAESWIQNWSTTR